MMILIIFIVVTITATIIVIVIVIITTMTITVMELCYVMFHPCHPTPLSELYLICAPIAEIQSVL